MPVPTLVTDLSTTLASNSPAGSDNVFPSLDDYLRALSGFVASIRDNSGNGWVSPYLPLTYSAGTANGVVYLNGSKVVTTGSALVFDGTNFSTTGTASATKLIPTGGSATGNGMYLPAANTLGFSTNGTERARITSGGDLLVGLSAATFVSTRLEVEAATNNNAIGSKTTQNNYAPLMAWNSATTGDNLFQYFYTEGTLTLRGSIDYNRAGGLVRYNTTSDYRAKDIIGPVQNPGATIDALKVYEGKMKGATQSRPMLIAHEAQEHVPFSVSGEKDEENPDGSPKFQQMDHASLVPLLLAEIQSLRARVAALEAA